MENKTNFLFLKFVLIALVFGIGGGIVGDIVTRAYILKDSYDIPLFGDINVPGGNFGSSGLVIESPRKVIVEQNTKALETIGSVSKNIVGIFAKKKNESDLKIVPGTSISSSYDLDKPLAQGFVLTSDGWIMSTYMPEDPQAILDKAKATTSLSQKQAWLDNYSIISKDGQVYKVSDFLSDSVAGVTFWRIDAKDLSVKQLRKISEISRGQIAIAVDFQGSSLLTALSSKYPTSLPNVLSSDRSYAELTMTDDLKRMAGSFVFNIEGDLIGVASSTGKVKPVNSFYSSLTNLLQKKAIKHPLLGVNYLELARFADANTSKILGKGALIQADEKGVAIQKGSPAEKAGLLAGDIIITANAVSLDRENTLSEVIAVEAPGNEVYLTIIRKDKEVQIKVILEGK